MWRMLAESTSTMARLPLASRWARLKRMSDKALDTGWRTPVKCKTEASATAAIIRVELRPWVQVVTGTLAGTCRGGIAGSTQTGPSFQDAVPAAETDVEDSAPQP